MFICNGKEKQWGVNVWSQAYIVWADAYSDLKS